MRKFLILQKLKQLELRYLTAAFILPVMVRTMARGMNLAV